MLLQQLQLALASTQHRHVVPLVRVVICSIAERLYALLSGSWKRMLGFMQRSVGAVNC
jgi:hypothetical protein